MSTPADLAAIANLLTSRPEAALEALEQLPLLQADPMASVLMGDALRRVGRPAEALTFLDNGCTQLRGDRDQRARAHWSRGLALRSLGRFRQAADAFLDAIDADPGFLPATHALQFTRLEQQELDALLPRFASLLPASGEPPLLAMVLAEWERRCGRIEPALIRSHVAARRATPASQRHLLDPGGMPTPPEALIVGVPKSGTTSLLGWLNRRRGIWAHPRKELHFFDNSWTWGPSWYACQFPVFRPDSGIVRIEATPNYFQLPECPARVLQIAPQARVIVVLREPVQRALSWFHHMQRQEGLVGDAVSTLEAEERELLDLTPKDRAALGYREPNCLAGSLYDLHLSHWQAIFRPEQLLVLCLEDLLEDPASTLALLVDFLGLPAARSGPEVPFPKANAAPAPYPPLPRGLEERLRGGLLSGAHDLWLSMRIGARKASVRL